jgi:hypothetical protein
MQTVSATDLARNTREILDKVVSGGETVAIERNHTMIAPNRAAGADDDCVSGACRVNVAHADSDASQCLAQ